MDTEQNDPEIAPAETRETLVFPGILQSIILVVVTALLMLGMGGIVSGLSISGIIDLEKHMTAALGIGNLIAVGLVIFVGLLMTRASFHEVYPMPPVDIKLFIPMMITLFGAVIVLSEVDNLVRTFLPIPKIIADMFMRLTSGEQSVFWTFFTLVVVAAFTEEFLFRGLILRGLLANYSVSTAIIVSSVLFGVLHGNPWQFVNAVALGALFAWWFIKTGSLIPCLFGHALNNTFAFVASVSLKDQPGFDINKVEFHPPWLDVIGVLLIAAGIGLFIRMIKEKEEQEERRIYETGEENDDT